MFISNTFENCLKIDELSIYKNRFGYQFSNLFENIQKVILGTRSLTCSRTFKRCDETVVL